eukprot:GFUD01032669.1.p1 GENE.GFUD01032669.1~~GFUD01032669.1.p1  ORF type:complete len:221 (-),score=65.38 GFUD01032669.1:586-1248(-)
MDVNKQIENILATAPVEFHEEILNHIDKNGITSAIVDKVIPLWTEEQQKEALEQMENNTGVFKIVLIDIFRVNETKRVNKSHREFIRRAFLRFKPCFSFLTEDQILLHDLTKNSFLELVGYTAKWVWNLHCPLWEAALAHHYHHNPHHPQHAPGHRMALSDLEESVVDMLACSWERTLGGGDEVTADKIGNVEEIYLERYLAEDREIVREVLGRIVRSNL